MSQQADGLQLPGDLLGSNDLCMGMFDRVFLAAFKGGDDNSWQACARCLRMQRGGPKPAGGGVRPPLTAREVVDWALDVARTAPAASGSGHTKFVRASGPVHFLTSQVGAY